MSRPLRLEYPGARGRLLGTWTSWGSISRMMLDYKNEELAEYMLRWFRKVGID